MSTPCELDGELRSVEIRTLSGAQLVLEGLDAATSYGDVRGMISQRLEVSELRLRLIAGAGEVVPLGHMLPRLAHIPLTVVIMLEVAFRDEQGLGLEYSDVQCWGVAVEVEPGFRSAYRCCRGIPDLQILPDVAVSKLCSSR